MIVRELADGGLILINQSDHAKLSGYFAAHWGNRTFARPEPYESVVRATMFHDAGWYAYETAPRLDATGKPVTFTQIALDAETLANFQWATDWMVALDPYAGLLMRKHRNGLWQGRYGAITHPPAIAPRQISDLLSTFIDRNETALRREEAAVDRATFTINYQLLQVWDFLSLFFCMHAPTANYIEPVPRDYTGEGTVRLDLRPAGSNRVVIDPWPFDTPTLPFAVVHRHVAKRTFADEHAFRRAYFEAPLDSFLVEFVPA